MNTCLLIELKNPYWRQFDQNNLGTVSRKAEKTCSGCLDESTWRIARKSSENLQYRQNYSSLMKKVTKSRKYLPPTRKHRSGEFWQKWIASKKEWPLLSDYRWFPPASWWVGFRITIIKAKTHKYPQKTERNLFTIKNTVKIIKIHRYP